MVEPAWPDRHVCLRGNPRLAVLVAFGQRLDRRRIVIADPVPFRLQHRPVGLARPTLLVADPADVGADVAEDHGIGLQLAHDRMETREVIDLALAVRALPARTFEPDLEDRPVVRQHLAQLRAEVRVVLLARTVLRVVAIPWRKIDAELESCFATRVAEFAQDVALAILPRARSHGVGAERRRPVAEAVVVLRGDDDSLHSRVLHDTDPLARVELGRVEHRRRIGAMAPLHAREGVRPEVDEPRELKVLPRELPRRRQRADRRRWRDGRRVVRSRRHREGRREREDEHGM